MKTNINTKITIGLLAAIITIGASLAVTRATAAEPETPKPKAGESLLLTAPRDPSLTQAPSDPDAVLRQIELSVALKQYEKVLTAFEDTELQIELGPEESGLSDEQSKEWRTKQGRKQMVLQDFSQRLRAKIEFLIAEGIKAAQAAADPVEPPPAQPAQAATDPFAPPPTQVAQP